VLLLLLLLLLRWLDESCQLVVWLRPQLLLSMFEEAWSNLSPNGDLSRLLWLFLYMVAKKAQMIRLQSLFKEYVHAYTWYILQVNAMHGYFI